MVKFIATKLPGKPWTVEYLTPDRSKIIKLGDENIKKFGQAVMNNEDFIPEYKEN